jgi:hypothetical protein
MFIVWSMVLGILIFMGIVLVTLLLGAAARSSEREILLRTEAQRRAGVTGDFTSDTPHSIHDRYVDV